MRVLMKCTAAWTAVVTMVLAYLFVMHGQNDWLPDGAFYVIALALIGWWMGRITWIFGSTDVWVFALGFCGLVLGVFVFFVWLFSFKIVGRLPLSQVGPAEWRWPMPAVISGAIIGL